MCSYVLSRKPAHRGGGGEGKSVRGRAMDRAQISSCPRSALFPAKTAMTLRIAAPAKRQIKFSKIRPRPLGEITQESRRKQTPKEAHFAQTFAPIFPAFSTPVKYNI